MLNRITRLGWAAKPGLQMDFWTHKSGALANFVRIILPSPNCKKPCEGAEEKFKGPGGPFGSDILPVDILLP
jgi:hypothetical protein